jgi:hypothetical protein
MMDHAKLTMDNLRPNPKGGIMKATTIAGAASALKEEVSAKMDLCNALSHFSDPEKGNKKSEKCEKSNFTIFRLEPAASQSVPSKMGGGDFSGFSKNFRGVGAKNAKG